MGIQGLLPFLEKSSRKANVSEFKGRTVAVDAYCWLHKGAFSCAEKLARKEDTLQYVHYCMKYINMLLSHNIKPILVFDGQHLPAKADTEKVRRERREVNRQKAAELLRSDRPDEARTFIRRCVDVTHHMALSLIRECRRHNVDCIVAPYEADAQLAFLNISAIAHLVITEDSDLIPFGCSMVLFKMDVNGNGVLVEQSMLPLAMKQRPEQFSLTKFRHMCILSGCDYLPSLPGIGLSKAKKFITTTVDNDVSRALTRMHGHLNMPNLVVTTEYREKFLEADSMFRHQPVFDPLTRRIVPLTPLKPGEKEPLPVTLSPEVALQLAYGNLDPFSLKRVDSWDPSDAPEPTKRSSSWQTMRAPHKSIWSSEYRLPKPLGPRPDPRDILKAPSTKNKTVVQPVSALAQKLSSFRSNSVDSNRSSCEEELEKFRELYGASDDLSPPPAKRSCLEAVAREVDSQLVELDDLIGNSRSPVSEGKLMRNSFNDRTILSKISHSPQKEGKRSTFLSRLSKIKRTMLDENTVVKSKYFGTAEEAAEVQVIEETQDISQLCEKVEETQESSSADVHTPVAKESRPTRLEDIISPIPRDESSKPELPTTPAAITKLEETPTSSTKKRNIFAVSKSRIEQESDFEKNFALNSNKKKRSFLSLIDSMGQVGKQDVEKDNIGDAASENTVLSKLENNKTPGRAVSSPAVGSFKWTKSLTEIQNRNRDTNLNGSLEKSAYFEQTEDVEITELLEETSRREECQLDPIFPDTPPSSQGTPSLHGSVIGAKNKTIKQSYTPPAKSLIHPAKTVGLTKKKSTPLTKKSPKSASDPKQTSLLTMFGFQPKSKLRL